MPIVSIVIYEGNAPLGTWNNQYECDVKSVPNATIDGWLTITGVLDSDPQIQIAAKIGEEYKWTEIFNAQRLTDTNTIVPLTEQQALLLATANELDFQGQNATITKIVYSYVDKSNQDIVTDTDTDTDTNSDTDTDTDTNTDKPRFILGDVNLDGVLDIIDVVLTRSHIVKSRPLTYLDADAPNRADMNGDYIVDIVDVVLMRKSIISKS